MKIITEINEMKSRKKQRKINKDQSWLSKQIKLVNFQSDLSAKKREDTN